MSYRLVLAVLVFALDAWAIHHVLGSTAPRRTRAKWVLAIVALPVVGVILWLRSARAARRNAPAVLEAENLSISASWDRSRQPRR